jgi:hypothetical protein
MGACRVECPGCGHLHVKLPKVCRCGHEKTALDRLPLGTHVIWQAGKNLPRRYGRIAGITPSGEKYQITYTGGGSATAPIALVHRRYEEES